MINAASELCCSHCDSTAIKIKETATRRPGVFITCRCDDCSKVTRLLVRCISGKTVLDVERG